ncbi:MAG: PQQ-binding-like beta-propeller repeat protein, partial [Planctomycetes bacterium]|nr:PQQ-binding-like beta-propeller repeat protein [Planctomycetota bacterium]
AEALAADERIGKLVNVPDPWPIEPVVAVAKDVKSSVTMRYPISLTDAAGRFPTELYATIDSQGQHIVGSDRLGRQTWDLDLGTRKHQWSTSSVVYSYSRGWINGNLLIAWVGNRICAIESSSSEAKLLWTRELITSPPPYPGFGMMLPARMRRVRQGDGFPGKEPSPLAATPQTICFQQDRKLTAVDPVSGQLLWTRDDLDAESDLFGDRYRLFVTSPAAGEEPEAVVLSMLDGRELGRRKVPKLSRRVATVGGYVVTWESDAQQTRAAMVDPWNNQTVWEHAFEPTAKAWLTGGDELAVLDPKGRLIILALADGSPILQTDLDLGPLEEQERRKKLKELEEQEGLEEQERLKKQKEIEDQKGLDGLEKLVVLRQADRYLVLACVPKPAGVMAMTQNLPNNVAVHGAMYGIRRADGKMLWKADVENQTVNLGQPADLPLIVLLNYVYERKGTSTKRFHKVCCIDTRTGRLEYDAQIEGHSTSICRIDAKPAESQIVIQTYRQTINVAFGPKAAQRMKVAKEAAAKAEAEKQEAAKKEAEAKAEAPKEEAEVKVATVKKEVKPETAEKPAPK